MYVLGAMSLLGLAFVFYFFFALRRKRIAPPEFLHDLQEMLIEGKLEEARNFCKGEPSPASAIALTATDYLLRVENPDTDMLARSHGGRGRTPRHRATNPSSVFARHRGHRAHGRPLRNRNRYVEHL